MKRFEHLRPYFTHILPLQYDLSLTPYEIISKLLKWLEGLTSTVNSDTAAILDMEERLTALEEQGFTDDQLREVLDEMVANGDFDFLIDLIASKTELWDTVGLKPYAQVLPEKANVNIAGYSFQSMAMGNIGGVKVGMFCFVHMTGDTDDGSIVLSYNLTNGELIGYNTTYSGHMNSVGFNPADSYFYVVPGGSWGKIVVYDYQCNKVKEISTTDASYKAGGIAFNKTTGNAYIVWYDSTGTDATVIINEVTELENRTDIDHTTYTQTVSWDRGEITAVGRQDIYCDDVFLYLPTYWHRETTLYHGTYNMQDVFKLSDLEYIRTQYIDAYEEVNGGEYFNGEYYIGLNIANSGLIFKAAVRCTNAYNSAYVNSAQQANSVISYGPYTLYANASQTNFLADGTLDKPFNRFAALESVTPAFNRYSGVRYMLSGDFTLSGQITNIAIRNSKQRLILAGQTSCILPKLTFDNCDHVELSDLTIYGYEANYMLYLYDTNLCLLDTVTFTPQVTVESVITLTDSKAEFTDCEITGSSFTLALTVGRLSRAKGRLEYGGTNTRIGEYPLVANTEKITDNGSYIIMTDNGIYINANIKFTAEAEGDDIILSLPTTYKVSWTFDRLFQPYNPYFFNGMLWYDTSTPNTIVAQDVIQADTDVTINALVPIGTITI